MSVIRNLFGIGQKQDSSPLDLSNMGERYEAHPRSGMQVLEIADQQMGDKKLSDFSAGPTRILTDPSETKTPTKNFISASQHQYEQNGGEVPLNTHVIGERSPIFSSKGEQPSRRQRRHHYYDFEDKYRAKNSAKSTEQVTNQQRLSSNRVKFSQPARTPQPKRHLERAQTIENNQGPQKRVLFQSVLVPQNEVKYKVSKSKIGIDPEFQKELDLVEMSFKDSTRSKSKSLSPQIPQINLQRNIFNITSKSKKKNIKEEPEFKNYIGFAFRLNKMMLQNKLRKHFQAMKLIQKRANKQRELESQAKLVKLLNCHYFKKVAWHQQLNLNKAFQRWKIKSGNRFTADCYKEVAIKARIHWHVAFWRFKKLLQKWKDERVALKKIQAEKEKKQINNFEAGFKKLARLNLHDRNSTIATISSFNKAKNPVQMDRKLRLLTKILEPKLRQKLTQKKTLRHLDIYGFKKLAMLLKLTYCQKQKQLISFTKLRHFTYEKMKESIDHRYFYFNLLRLYLTITQERHYWSQNS